MGSGPFVNPGPLSTLSVQSFWRLSTSLPRRMLLFRRWKTVTTGGWQRQRLKVLVRNSWDFEYVSSLGS